MEPIGLHSGRLVDIRPIRSDDADRIEAAYARLSPQARYQRFLTAKPRLSAEEVRYLTQVDGHDHVALVATPVWRPELIIGVGRFVRDHSDPSAAEFAIVVGDHFQGEGLGTELLGRLADAALERGISRFTATVLAENEAVRALLRRLAVSFEQVRRDGAVDELMVQLAA